MSLDVLKQIKNFQGQQSYPLIADHLQELQINLYLCEIRLHHVCSGHDTE